MGLQWYVNSNKLDVSTQVSRVARGLFRMLVMRAEVLGIRFMCFPGRNEMCTSVQRFGRKTLTTFCLEDLDVRIG